MIIQTFRFTLGCHHLSIYHYKKLFRYCPLTVNHNRIFSGLMWSLWSINYNLWGNTWSIWVDWCPNHHTLFVRSFQVAVFFLFTNIWTTLNHTVTSFFINLQKYYLPFLTMNYRLFEESAGLGLLILFYNPAINILSKKL